MTNGQCQTDDLGVVLFKSDLRYSDQDVLGWPEHGYAH